VSERRSLILMLHQLLEDMLAIQQQGAGYYSCLPMIRRYNKLLDMARRHAAEPEGLISTFEAIEESEPKDPGYKMKVVQGIRVEIGQLIALLESQGSNGDAE
jgi:hypothetical protein